MPSDPSEIKENKSDTPGNFITDQLTKRNMLAVVGSTMIGGGIVGSYFGILENTDDKNMMEDSVSRSCTIYAREVVRRFNPDEFYESLGSEAGDKEYESKFNVYRDGNEIIGNKDEQLVKKLRREEDLSRQEEISLGSYLEEEYGMFDCSF